MGWRLAEEVAWARPARPGGEWWTLMDIAQDARDETRQSMCGHEYLMQRAKCSRATLYRRLEALRKSGLVKVARRSAPGIRAIYEIAELHSIGLTIAETRSNPPGPVDNPNTGLTDGETRSASNGSQNEPERVSESAERVSAFVRHTPSVPRHYNPVITMVPSAQPEVEGAELPMGDDRKPRNGHWRDPAELALQQASEARAARIARESK